MQLRGRHTLGPQLLIHLAAEMNHDPLHHLRRASGLCLSCRFRPSFHISLLILYQEADMATTTAPLSTRIPTTSAASLPGVWKPHHNPWAVALTVTLATFMEVLDTSI